MDSNSRWIATLWRIESRFEKVENKLERIDKMLSYWYEKEVKREQELADWYSGNNKGGKGESKS